MTRFARVTVRQCFVEVSENRRGTGSLDDLVTSEMGWKNEAKSRGN